MIYATNRCSGSLGAGFLFWIASALLITAEVEFLAAKIPSADESTDIDECKSVKRK